MPDDYTDAHNAAIAAHTWAEQRAADDSAPFADALAHAWLDAICDGFPHGHFDTSTDPDACPFCYAVRFYHPGPDLHADDDPAADPAY